MRRQQSTSGVCGRGGGGEGSVCVYVLGGVSVCVRAHIWSWDKVKL